MTIKCAIYTRKSTEHGLDQEFNSLQNQEESCKAYIASQSFNGWQYYKTYSDAAIILFAVFSDGLLAGLITALSALIAYTCCELLYREYRAAPKSAAKPARAKRSAKKTK